MIKLYNAYKCKRCKKEFILLAEDIDTLEKDRYIACPYCNSKHIVLTLGTNDLKECMKERAYRKEHGAIRQVRDG